MNDLTLSGLYIYPVKSLTGIHLQHSAVDHYGLQYDRRWMVVDQEGEFLSQRRLPRMTLIRQRVEGDALILQAADQPDLHLPLNPVAGAWTEVRIWDERCQARHCDAAADSWLSRFLEQPCRLVYLPEDVTRGVDPDYAMTTDKTAFTDGFPLMLLSEASLQELNGRLEQALPMTRFRPNLVVSGCAPYAEDSWSLIRIGELQFRVVKPCSRCIITTVDPATAARGSEPLQTLSKYRRHGNKVYFGQNLLHDATGNLTLGMHVQVLESGTALLARD